MALYFRHQGPCIKYDYKDDNADPWMIAIEGNRYLLNILVRSTLRGDCHLL